MLILGSQSPRRKEILSYFRIPFTVQSSDFNESTLPLTLPPVDYARLMAEKKAGVFTLKENETVLTADTIVVLGSNILGKPSSLDHAVEMLLSLSGTTHEVITGVCVRTSRNTISNYASTTVHFAKVSKEDAIAYANHFKVLDKAGGYAIQEGGGIVVNKIEGCFYNVMGLPLQLTIEMLNRAGIHVWESLQKV